MKFVIRGFLVSLLKNDILRRYSSSCQAQSFSIMARATTPWSRGALDFNNVDLRGSSDHEDSNCVILEDGRDDCDSLTPMWSPISKAHHKKGSSSELENFDSAGANANGDSTGTEEDTIWIPDDDIKPGDLTVFYRNRDLLTMKEDDALDGEEECVASDVDESTLEGNASLSGDENSPNSSCDYGPKADETAVAPSVETLNGKVDEFISDPLGDNPGSSCSGPDPGADQGVGIDEDSSSIPDHEPENIEEVIDGLVADSESNQRKRSHAEVNEDVKLKPGNVNIYIVKVSCVLIHLRPMS